jgi:hypothetical protein
MRIDNPHMQRFADLVNCTATHGKWDQTGNSKIAIIPKIMRNGALQTQMHSTVWTCKSMEEPPTDERNF